MRSHLQVYREVKFQTTALISFSKMTSFSRFCRDGCGVFARFRVLFGTRPYKERLLKSLFKLGGAAVFAGVRYGNHRVGVFATVFAAHALDLRVVRFVCLGAERVAVGILKIRDGDFDFLALFRGCKDYLEALPLISCECDINAFIRAERRVTQILSVV